MIDDNAINPETGETVYVGICEKLPAGFKWIHEMSNDQWVLLVIKLREKISIK